MTKTAMTAKEMTAKMEKNVMVKKKRKQKLTIEQCKEIIRLLDQARDLVREAGAIFMKGDCGRPVIGKVWNISRKIHAFRGDFDYWGGYSMGAEKFTNGEWQKYHDANGRGWAPLSSRVMEKE